MDDVASNRELLIEYFSGTHHNIILANDGHEAIEKVSNITVDLILMDLQMPNMDGYEGAIRLARKHVLNTGV